MYRRNRNARLLTGGLIGAPSGTVGRRGVGSVDSGSPPITNAVDLDGAADYLTFTPSSTTDRQTFTVSAWVKRGSITNTAQYILGAYSSFTDTGWFSFFFNGGNNLRCGALSTHWISTTGTYTNTSEWLHVVLSMDVPNEQVRMFVNGVEPATTGTTPPTSHTFPVNTASVAMTVGRHNYDGGSSYFDGQIADMHFIDGQALTADDFGEDVGGTWSAKAYTGTYGTNGFYLDFADSANLGTDNSGNGNDFTEVSLTTGNQVAISTSDIPQVVQEATTLRARGYIGAAPALDDFGMLTLYDRYLRKFRPAATGGTESTINVSGQEYRLHVFNSSGTFTVPAGGLTGVEYLVIGGGGGGAGRDVGGGGGAGGYRCSVPGESSGGGASAEQTLSLAPGSYTVTVGAGGAGGRDSTENAAKSQPGEDSVFATITAEGGGAGQPYNVAVTNDGGSGGGASALYYGNGLSNGVNDGGVGTNGQGYDGGKSAGSGVNDYGGGGGGGAGAPGGSALSGSPDGGDGVQSSITGVATYRGGGGGGAGHRATGNRALGSGGLGGGGDANASTTTSTRNGTANTGGGAGASRNTSLTGGTGGSGVVIIRYKI